jgi:hypothetical protein
MTNEQILELAKTCGFIVWECAEEQLLKFAQAIRKETIEEVLTSLKDVPNPEANRTAINRIEWL